MTLSGDIHASELFQFIQNDQMGQVNDPEHFGEDTSHVSVPNRENSYIYHGQPFFSKGRKNVEYTNHTKF